MFLRYSMREFKPTNEIVSMPHMSDYISFLDTRRQLMMDRYGMSFGYESYGVRILKHLLTIVDMDTVRSFKTDAERYSRYLVFMQEDMDRFFNPSVGFRIHQKGFTQTTQNEKVLEFIVPTNAGDYRSQYPFEKGWAAWRKVRPVRLLDMGNSLELTFHAIADRLLFRYDPPQHVVVGIDTAALILQYARYLDNVADPDAFDPMAVYFHQYVVLPALLTDAADLWLRNIYLRAFSDNSDVLAREVKSNSYLWAQDTHGYIGDSFYRGLREITQIKQKIQRGNIKPIIAFSNLPLVVGTAGLYVRNIQDICTMPEQRQASWLEFLRDEKWLRLMYACMALRPEGPMWDAFQRRMKRDVLLLRSERIQNTISVAKTREYVEKQIADFVGTVSPIA